MSKCAIVTGGLKGIGKAVALQLAEDGYNIVATYVSNYSSEALDEYKALFNVEVLCLQADVASFEDSMMVIEESLKVFDNIDILVNNAGITNDKLLLKMKPEDFSNVIDTNLVGSFNMIKAVSKKMIKQKYGRIINMSSVIGEIGNVGQANYAASKAGLFGLSKSVAKELASRNITVNCVAPGFIDTDMSSILDESIIENIKRQIPSKKLGKPSDVANLVSFLSSDKASYITGQVINVCGGMVM